MKCHTQYILIASLLAAGLSAARTTDATEPTAPAPVQQTLPKPRDVELQPSGVMLGTLLDQQGMPVAQREVQLISGANTVARAVTDQRGGFQLRGVRPGTYVLGTEDGVAIYRAWAPRTAPPAAQPQVVMYTGQVARGFGHQKSHSIFAPKLPSINVTQILHSPTTIGVAIGTALAVPIALHDDENGS